MFTHYASRMVIHLLFPGLEEHLSGAWGNASVSYSAITALSHASVEIDASCIYHTAGKDIIAFIGLDGYPSAQRGQALDFLAHAAADSELMVRMVCKKDVRVRIEVARRRCYLPSCYRIDVAARTEAVDSFISIYLPSAIFNIISRTVCNASSAEELEQKICLFFQHPAWMVPSLSLLFSSLPSLELQRLFYHLRRSQLLTPYQIFLVLQAMPWASGTIKRLLSKRLVGDVIQFAKQADSLRITARDIAGGVYSVEEAVYFTLRSCADVSYSRLLSHMQHIAAASLRARLLAEHPFVHWLSIMASDRLLHRIISLSDERLVMRAISVETKECVDILRHHLSAAKLEALTSANPHQSTIRDVEAAREMLILQYRTLKAGIRKADPERFPLLITDMEGTGAYTRLLLTVGWFTLSTALKGVHPKVRRRVLAQLPRNAAALIDDVVHGTVNPNILHDEMQIRDAQRACVRAILQLYEEGSVSLTV